MLEWEIDSKNKSWSSYVSGTSIKIMYIYLYVLQIYMRITMRNVHVVGREYHVRRWTDFMTHENVLLT